MRIAFLGDSITEGVGASSSEKCYVKQIERILNCEALNYGVSGTRIARQIGYYNSYPITFDWDFQQRVDIMREDVDRVFVFGGTNDFGHGDSPIGDDNSRDPYTFCGGLRNLIEKLIKKYGRGKICFLLPLRRLIENIEEKKIFDYIERMKIILREYGVTFLDFYQDGLPQPIDGNDARYFIDGLHPNDLGHSIIANKICSYLMAENEGDF